MKKLIIALGALAIANFSFILPVKAELVDKYEVSKATGYMIDMAKIDRDITVDYDTTTIIQYLAVQSCKYKDLSRALAILKNNYYEQYAVTVINYNDNQKFKEFIKIQSLLYCPEIDIKF